MPEVVSAPTVNEPQPESHEAAGGAGARPQVRAVEFPEAPPDHPAACGSQLDILLDMDVPVAVVLGTTQIPVRRLLQLGPGSVLRLDKSIEAPADLYLKDARFAQADVVVVDNQFAIRIKQILGPAPAHGPSDPGPAGPVQG
jgi:flagellar motor switch protein FliN/FliY